MENQAKYKKFKERLYANWPDFINKRKSLLIQEEKIVEMRSKKS